MILSSEAERTEYVSGTQKTYKYKTIIARGTPITRGGVEEQFAQKGKENNGKPLGPGNKWYYFPDVAASKDGGTVAKTLASMHEEYLKGKGSADHDKYIDTMFVPQKKSRTMYNDGTFNIRMFPLSHVPGVLYKYSLTILICSSCDKRMFHPND